MPTYNLPNGTTPDEILGSISTSVPVLPIMLLVFSWFVIFLGGVLRQNTKSGYADLPMWASIASLGCLLLSLVLTVRSGFIVLEVLMVVIAVTIFSGVWFFLSRGRYE